METQSVLPDLTGFSLVGSDIKNGEACDKWVKKEVIGDKMNKYQMWVKTVRVPEKPGMGMAVPIHYEMKGYNSLLGSHFDHYYLSYEASIDNFYLFCRICKPSLCYVSSELFSGPPEGVCVRRVQGERVVPRNAWSRSEMTKEGANTHILMPNEHFQAPPTTCT